MIAGDVRWRLAREPAVTQEAAERLEARLNSRLVQLFEMPSHSLADFRQQLASIQDVTVEQAQRLTAQLRRELDEAQRKARRYEAPTADAAHVMRHHAAILRMFEPATARLTPMPAAPSTTFALTVPRGVR